MSEGTMAKKQGAVFKKSVESAFPGIVSQRNQRIALDRQEAQKEAQRRKLNQQALDFLRARFRTSVQGTSTMTTDAQASSSPSSLFAQITGA